VSEPTNSEPRLPKKIIVVVGSLNTDFVVTLDSFPSAGETVLGETFEQFPGGKGLNQAVAASRLGAYVTMIGAVGNDHFADALVTTLTTESITSHVEQGARVKHRNGNH